MDIKTTTNGKLTARQVAELFGISVQAVYKWEVPPPETVIKICEEANFVVTPHELRPDIYPNPTDGLPRSLCVCVENKEAA